MATINFELSKQLDKGTKKSQILVRVSISRSFRVGGKTGLFISPKDWDSKTMSIRKISRIESRDKQRELEDLRAQLDRLQEHLGQVIIDTKDIDSLTDKKDRQDWIEYAVASFFDPAVKLVKEKNLSFKEFSKIYCKVRSQEEEWPLAKRSVVNQKKKWEHPSYDKLSAVQTQINKMNERLRMDEITGATLDEYQKFLIKQGYKNSTIENHVSYFKQILKWAYEKGYLRHGEDVMKHKTKTLKLAPRKAVIYLKWDEFEKLYSYKFPANKQYLELTRDRFCFCCLTSLRHSDLDILRRSNFDDAENPTKFSFISKKTSDDLTIFLVPEALELYKKYTSIPTGGLAFPKKSNQKMNKGIKEIAKMIGLSREVEVMQYCGKTPIYRTEPLCDVIGTHAARRTFVVHALEEGMSPEMVMTYTGHADYDTMKPYIALTDKKRQNALLNCFQMKKESTSKESE